ncbi:MAG TPA: hypothetical protein GX516_05520 [Thermoanaerobacter sp.]|nr:hypothetical protein [Thermoanaerobacter sp.]
MSIADIIKEEAEKLKNRDLNELAETFKEIFAEILQASAEENPFTGWVLSQAPISIIKPNSRDTAFAADKGIIYINPAFINATARTAEERGYSPRDIYQLYGYIIAHEMAHIILQHPWDLKKIISIQEHIPWEIKKEIANISMDYIINMTFCNALYSSAPHHILEIIDSRDAFEKSIKNMDAFLDSHSVLEEIRGRDDIEDMAWEDLYYLITKHIRDINALDAALNLNGSSQSAQGSPKSSSQNSSKNHESIEETTENTVPGSSNQSNTKKTVWTAHGEEKEIEEEFAVREGYLEKYKNEEEAGQGKKENLTDRLKDIQEIVDQMKEEFMHRMREAGLEKGGFHRSFVDSLKADTTPLKAKIKTVLSGIIQGQLRVSAWDRLSRRMPYLTPGTRIFPKPSMWFLIDVSGSVSENELSAVMSSIKDLLESRTIGKAVMVTFDAGKTGFFEAKTAKDLKNFEISGGGGTELSPAIEEIEKSLKWGDITVVATDSALGDDPERLKGKIKDVVRATSHAVIWLHFGDERYLNEIINHSRNDIIPMVIEPERERITIKNYKKGVRI